MTHKQAWLTVAEAYATLPKDRTKEQWGLTETGICNAITNLEPYEDRVSFIYDGMRRVNKHRHGYWWLFSRKHDILRCTFACFFAAMTKKEFEQLLECSDG